MSVIHPSPSPPEAAAQRRGLYTAGDTIADRYVLVRLLGEGGMGVVWVARSTALDIEVALKLIHGSLAGTDAVERMAREARTAAQLGHPAIARVLDYGRTRHGDPFMVMELLQGEDLFALLKRDKHLSGPRAVGLLLPILEALATAHDHGIVHRDVKPENVFIARDVHGQLQPKLLDFGVAKMDGGPQERLTRYGAVLGSPSYLSPEQARGDPNVDARSDVWAVGVVLYELLTGAPPFDGDSYNALIHSISTRDPKPIVDQVAGDARLWAIIERCLRKDPEERWVSMWELGEALALWLFEQGVKVDAASRSLRDVWLERGVTGVKMIVQSVSPPPEARGAQALDGSLAQVTTVLRARPRAGGARRWAALGAAAVLTLAIWAALRSSGSGGDPPKSAALSAESPRADTPAPTAVSSLEALPSAPSGPTAEPRIVPASASSAASPADEPGKSGQPSKTEKARSQRPAPGPRRPKAASSLGTEFGF